MTDNEFLNPFDQFDPREETSTPPIPGDAPPPLAPEALRPGQMSVPFDADPTIAGTQAQDHANKSIERDTARETSSASILRNWGTLDDAARDEWVKGERAAGQSQAEWWQGARDYVVEPLKNLNRAVNKFASGSDYDGHDSITGWLDRKTNEMVALGKRRQFLADEIEAGRAEAAKISATRNTAEQAGKGLGEGIGNILAGTGRGANYATDAILSAMGAPRDMSKPDQRYFGNALQDVGNWVSHKAEEYFPGDEARQNEFSGKLGQGIGSMASFLGPSMTISLLTRAGPKTIAAMAEEYGSMDLAIAAANKSAARVATATSAGLGAPMQAEAMAQDAEAARDKGTLKADGTPVTDADIRMAYMLGLPIGATEAAPIGHLLERLGASGLVRGVLVQAAEEGGQEWVQSVLENATAQRLYDPERRWDDGAWEAAAIGAILGSGMEVATHAKERVKEARLRTKGTATDAEPSVAPAPDAAASPEIALPAAVPAQGTKPPREPKTPLKNALAWPEDENIDDLEAVPGMTTRSEPETDLRTAADPVIDDLNSSFEALVGKPEESQSAPVSDAPYAPDGLDVSEPYVDRLSQALGRQNVDQATSEPGPADNVITTETDFASAAAEQLGAVEGSADDFARVVDSIVSDRSVSNADLRAIAKKYGGSDAVSTRAEAAKFLKDRRLEMARSRGMGRTVDAMFGNAQQEPSAAGRTADEAISALNRARTVQAPGKLPEKASTDSAPTPEMKAAFREVLRGDKPSKAWARAVGANPEQMKALLKDAKRQKLIRKSPGGVVRRTALAKTLGPKVNAKTKSKTAVGDYISQALRNLQKTSRTASGIVDTSASKEKAGKIVEGLTGETAAKAAHDNVVRAMQTIYDKLDDLPKTGAAMAKFVDEIALDINKGILKPDALYRTDDSVKYPYTAAKDLALAHAQFAQGLVDRLADKNADPVETAAWIEWRANLTDHFWADGVGKTSKALAAIPLMRAGLPLPEYGDNKEFFAHGNKAPRDPKSGPDAYSGPDYDSFVSYYRSLMPGPGSRADLAAREQKARDDMATPEFLGSRLGGGVMTAEQPGYMSPEWKRNRQYVAADGSAIQGYDAVVAHLVALAESRVPGGVKNEGKAVITIGFPGAGKGTIAKAASAHISGAHITADDAKLMIPEYEDGFNANGVHDESSDIAADATAALAAKLGNLVLEKVGSSDASISKAARELRAVGYQVSLIYVDVPKGIAMERAVNRWRETKRPVDPGYYDRLNIGEVYTILKQEGTVDDTAKIEWIEPAGWRIAELGPSLAGLTIPSRKPSVGLAGVAGASRGKRDEPGAGRSGAEAGSDQVLKPTGKTLPWLKTTLEKYGVDTSRFGVGEAKPLDRLASEIDKGESVLILRDGKPVRRVSAASIEVIHEEPNGDRFRLREDRQVFADGRERRRNLAQSISEKLVGDEDAANSVGRALQEELGITSFTSDGVMVPSSTTRESPTYPGIKTEYQIYTTEVTIDPAEFKEEYREDEEGQANYFRWQRVNAPTSQSLTIPPEQRVDRVIRLREDATGKIWPEFMVQFATRLEVARGTKKFNPILAEVKADKRITKALALELAHAVGVPPKSATTKAQALKSIADRHKDLVKVLASAAQEQANADNRGLEQGAGDVSEASVPGQVQGDEGGRNAQGALPESGRGRAGDVRGNRGASDAGAGPSKRLPGEGSAAGSDSGTGAGRDKSRANPRPIVDEELKAQIAADLAEERAEIETARADRIARNYKITDDDKIGQGGAKAKVRANIEAIRTLKKIEDEGRAATDEEKKVLVKYVGWGAFSQPMFADYNVEFAKERAQLKNLLTPDEYRSAQASVLNAHYTSPEVIKGMWQALEHLGFKGGRVIEPAAGIGHFIGLQPEAMRGDSSWTAVELDTISGGITKALYGAADVRVGGFEAQVWPNDHFDLAISNVPFDKTGPYDPAYKTQFSLHDYFFVKALDKVRPGGLVAFITSRYSLDKERDGARLEMEKRGTFLGAIRLPGGNKGAFKANAGTDVTTDIIFFRKKMQGEPLINQEWRGLEEIKTPEGPTEINGYFAAHPDMMLGKMRLLGTQYSKGEPVLIGPSENIQADIKEAAEKLPADAMVDRGTTVAPVDETDTDVGDGVKEGAFYDKGGKIYRKIVGVGIAQKLNKADEARVRSFMSIRDVLNDVLSKQASGDSAGMDNLRDELGRAYDAFVKEHGPINKADIKTTTRKDGKTVTTKRMPNFAPFRDDQDAYKVAAIENYDAKTGKATKAAIFTEDIVAPYQRPEIAAPSDALAVSLNETGKVDIKLIADMLGTNERRAVETLGDSIYLSPNGEQWQTAGQYLSGDVVTKLEQAKAAAALDAAKYGRNVAALEAVQPIPLTRNEITLPLGASYIPEDVINEFLNEVLETRNAAVALNPGTFSWSVRSLGNYNPAMQAAWGTNKVDVKDIVEAALNSKPITITWKDRDGVTHRDLEGEALAQAKVTTLKEAFTGEIYPGALAAIGGWVWQAENRAQRLEGLYNQAMNRLVKETHDGSHLTFPGLARVVTGADGSTFKIDLGAARTGAIWRIIQNGNTLIDHVVGAGKTWTSIMAVQEMKRLGQIRRPMFVVPNHMLMQFSNEFLQAYPAAKLLVATKDNMSRERRAEFAAKAAAEKWDGIIITHSAFSRLKMQDSAYKDYYQDALFELEAAKQGEDSATVKDIEKAKKRIVTKLDKLLKKEKKDQGITFEELGVDHLTVDEAHLFKNLWFMTRHTRIKGISNSSESQRASDLFIKIRHLEKSRPGRSALFLTGTPLSNTMAEVYTMMRYLQHDTLKEYGIANFDSWAQTFGMISSSTRLAPNGRDYRDETRFNKFVNIPELSALYARIADTQTAESLGLKRPNIKGGVPKVITSELSDQEESLIRSIIEKMEELKGAKPEKGQPNFLSMFTKGLQASTDARLVDPSAEFNPEGKIAKAVDNIARIYEEGNADPKAPNKAQIVFLDMGVPGSRAGKKPVKVGGRSLDDIFGEEDDGVAPIDKVREGLSGLEEETDEDGDAAEMQPEASEDDAEVEKMLYGKFNLYEDMKNRLIEKGVPAHEIAFIHDAKTDEQKAKLFEAVREGGVRVLIGSTGKMGVGTNVQKRLIALHHIDAPWKPADLEQRDGRILRQGNKNEEIEIYRYITKRSFEAYRWQILQDKDAFIAQFRAGARGLRIAEDIDSPVPDAGEIKAAATGDRRMVEQAELDRTVRGLLAQASAHAGVAVRAHQSLEQIKRNIEGWSKWLTVYEADAAKVQDVSGDNFKITAYLPGGQSREMTDRKKAGEALRGSILALAGNAFYGREMDIEFGNISGFEMGGTVKKGPDGIEFKPAIKGKTEYTSQDALFVQSETNPVALIGAYSRLLAKVPGYLNSIRSSIAEGERQIPSLEAKTVKTAFPKQAELEEKQKRLAEITESLKPKKEAPAAPEAAPDRQIAEGKISPAEFAKGVADLKAQLGTKTIEMPDAPAGDELPSLIGVGQEIGRQLAMVGQKGSRVNAVRESLGSLQAHTTSIVSVASRTADVDIDNAQVPELRVYQKALNDLSQIVTAELDAAYEIKDNLDALAEKATDAFDSVWTELGNISYEARELQARINEAIEGIDDVFPDLYAEDEDSDTGSTDLTVRPLDEPVYPEGYTLLDIIAEETGGHSDKLTTLANRVDEIIKSFDELEITEDEARAIADKLYDASNELGPLIWNSEFWGDVANNRMTEAADLINGMIENSVIPAIDTLEETAGEVSDKLDEVTDLIDTADDTASDEAPNIPGLPVISGETSNDDTLASIIGFHGSANVFDTFSDDKIGTGVDANAEGGGEYGPAHYISSLKAKSQLYTEHAIKTTGKGHLYQVEIDIEPNEVLNWHQPASEQGELGERIIAAVKARDKGSFRLRSGYDIMFALGHDMGNPNFKVPAVAALKALGVKAIAYTETFTLGDMQPHWDMAVLDSSRLKITHRDGKPVTAQERDDVLASMIGGGQQQLDMSPAARVKTAAPAKLTPRAQQMAPEIIAQIETELRQALPPDIAVRMADILFFHGSEAAGVTSMSKKLVQVSLNSGAGVAQETARHEVIHVLREYKGFGILSGLYSDEEWATLVARAQKIKAGRDIRVIDETNNTSAPGVFLYRDIYEQRGRADELVNQELVAKMAETWVDGARYGTQIDKLIYRAFEFFDAILRALKTLGFNTPTDVFGTESDAVLRDTFGGEIAARANQIENDPFRSDTLAAKIQTYHGTPNTWEPEKLVRMPDGSEQYVPFDAVPPGARVIKSLPAGRFRFDRTRPGAHQAFGPGFYSAENFDVAQEYETALGLGIQAAVIKLDGIPADEPANGGKLADAIAKRDALKAREKEYHAFAREIDSIIASGTSYRTIKIRSNDTSLTADLKEYVKKYTHRKMYYPNAPKYGGESLQLAAAQWLENFPSRAAAIKGIDKSIAGIKEGMQGKSRDEQNFAHNIIRDYYRKQAILEAGTEEKGVLWDDMISKAAALEKDFRKYLNLEKQVRDLERKKGTRFKSKWLHEDGVDELKYYKSLDEMRKTISAGAKYPPALEAIDELQELMDAGRLTWEPIAKPKTGGIYQLSLNVDDDQLIDWDKPIKKQPKSVQDGLRKVYPELWKTSGWLSPSSWFKALFGRPNPRFGMGDSKSASLDSMPSDIIRKAKDQNQLREALIAAGIPGIRFYDGFSRKLQKGTHNYVIFDPDAHVEVTHKDGTPVSDIERELVIQMSQDQYAKGKDDQLAALIGAPSRDTLRTEIEEMLRHEGFDKNGPGVARDGSDEQDQAIAAGNAGAESGSDGSEKRRRKIDPGLRTKALTGLIGDYYSKEAVEARRIAQGFTTKAYHATLAPLFDTPNPFVTNKDFGFHASLNSAAGANERIGFGDRTLTLKEKAQAIIDTLFGDKATHQAFPEDGKVIPIWINAGKSLDVPDIILGEMGEVNGWANPYAWLDMLGKHAGGTLELSELKLWVRNWIKERRESGRIDAKFIAETAKVNGVTTEDILSTVLAHDFSRDLGAKLESMGYDSVTYTNEVEAPGTKSIFVWNPARARSNIDLFHESAVDKPGFEASADVVLSDARKVLNELADELGYGDDVFASMIGARGAENLAKTNPAAKAALTMAEDMEGLGYDRDQIWDATAEYLMDNAPDSDLIGVYRGVEGEWRIEIDDSKRFNPRLHAEGQSIGTVSEQFPHKTLYAAHPNVGQAKSRVFWPNDVVEGEQLPGEIVTSGPRKKDIRDVGSHEIQHLVQDEEDFARGSDPKTARRMQPMVSSLDRDSYFVARDLLRTMFEAEQQGQKLSVEDAAKISEQTWGGRTPPPLAITLAKDPKAFEALGDRIALATGDEAYRRSAGEAEARLVQNRLDMTADERRARPPYLDYDVPEDKQIVHFDDGARASVAKSVDAGLADLAGKIEGTTKADTRSGSQPGPVQALSAIIADLKAALGMPTTQGRYGLTVYDGSTGAENNRAPRAWRFRPQDNLRAQYHRRTGAARYKLSTDIEAIAHEGGHHIETLLGPSFGTLKRAHADELRSYAYRSYTPPAAESPYANAGFSPRGFSGLELDADAQRLAVEWKAAFDQQLMTGDKAKTDRLRAELDYRIGPKTAGKVVTDIHVYAQRNRVPTAAIPDYVRTRFSENGVPQQPKIDTRATLSEGFAEFFREYLLTPNDAALYAPEFKAAFEDFLDANAPALLQKIERAQLITTSKAYDDYLKATTLDRAKADLVSEADQSWSTWAKQTEVLKGIGQADTISGKVYRIYSNMMDVASGAAGQIYTMLVDENHPWYLGTKRLLEQSDQNQRVDADGRAVSLAVHENPYKLVRSLGDSFKTGLRWIQDGVPNYQQQNGPRSASLHSALALVMGSKWNIDAYQTFGVYLESRRAVEEWKTWTAKRRAMADTSYQITVATEQNKALRDALAKEQAKTGRRERASTGNDAVIRDYDRIIQGLITQEANEVRGLQEGQVATPGMTKQQERNARIRLADIREKINAYEERRKDLVVRRNSLSNDRQVFDARVAQYESEIAKREALIERARARLKDMRENGIQRDPHRVKQAEHEARIAEIEKAMPNVKQAAALVYDFVWQSAIHDFQAGRLTKAELDYRATRRHFYVPFARDLSDMIAERGFGGRSAAAKKFAKDKAFAGSDRAVVNPLETIIDQTFHRAAATHFNGVMKAFINLADSVGAGGAAVAERVTQNEILAPDSDGFKQIVNRLVSMGYSVDDAHEMVKRIESDFGDTQLLLQWSPEGHGANKPLLLPLWEDGERKLIRLNDPEWANLVYNSVNGIGRDMTDIFTNLLSKPATLLRAGVTTNPAFVLPNIIRDMWSAWILTGSLLDPRTWPGITQARGLYHEFAQTDSARAYQEVAGIMGGQNVAALSKVRDKADVMALKSRGLHIKPFRLTAASAIGAAAGFSTLGPAGGAFGAILGAGLHNGVRNFWETLAHFSDMSETATRLGVFTQAYKEALAYNPALTPFQASQEAAYVARDLIDFGRRGSKMLAAARLVPFLNANVQGLDKAGRAFLARGDRGMGLGASKIGAIGALGAGAGYLAAGAVGGSAAAFAAPAAAVALAARSDAARRLLAPYSKKQFGLPVSAEEERVMGESAKAWANLLLYTLILASFAALYHDDDEYRMISDRVKHRGQPVKLGGEWYQVPKAFEYAIPANIIEAGINLTFDKDPRFWERVRDSLQENISPPMLPQALRLWSDIRSNYNSLSSRQIVPEYQKALPPQEQFNAYTSQMAIAVSRAINESAWGKPVAEGVTRALFANPNFEISPAIIDYALSTGGGYWGKDVQKTSNTIAGRDLGPKTGRIEEYPIIGTVLQRLSVDPARASEALQTYYQEMSPVAQGYPRAAAGYDTVLKNRGQMAANAMLATLDEDHRAYALLMGSADVNNKRLHPLNRLQDVIGSITSMEQDLAYGRLADTSDKKDPQPILLAPAQAAEMRDALAKIKAIEANNTFVALRKDQFAERRELDVQPALDVLKAISPEAAEELQRRYDRKHVVEFDQAIATWPEIRQDLLDTWTELAPTGEPMPNPKKRRGVTLPGMMRLGGPVPARPADLPRLDDDPAAGIGYPTDAKDGQDKFDEGIVTAPPEAPSNMREIDARKSPYQSPQNDVDDLRWQEKQL